MIKIFTTNSKGKIELTKEELKELLDEAYWEGAKRHTTSWTYTSPAVTPYYYTTSTTGTITLNSKDVTNSTESQCE